MRLLPLIPPFFSFRWWYWPCFWSSARDFWFFWRFRWKFFILLILSNTIVNIVFKWKHHSTISSSHWLSACCSFSYSNLQYCWSTSISNLKHHQTVLSSLWPLSNSALNTAGNLLCLMFWSTFWVADYYSPLELILILQSFLSLFSGPLTIFSSFIFWSIFH